MSHVEQRDSSVVTQMFRHDTWANLKLLEFCERLSDEQLDSTAVGTYGSIRDTLVHILGAEVSYVHRVNGRLPDQSALEDGFQSFGVLKNYARWAGEELLRLALSARADTIVHQKPPRLHLRYKLPGLMAQVIHHSNEHRTQVLTILTQLGLEPPELSGWQYMDEMGELEELGDVSEGEATNG